MLITPSSVQKRDTVDVFRRRLERVIEMPVAQPTSCAFGGPDLDELFVTSAWKGLSATERAAQPLAGSLFRVRPGVRGVAPVPFGG